MDKNAALSLTMGEIFSLQKHNETAPPSSVSDQHHPHKPPRPPIQKKLKPQRNCNFVPPPCVQHPRGSAPPIILHMNSAIIHFDPKLSSRSFSIGQTWTNFLSPKHDKNCTSKFYLYLFLSLSSTPHTQTPCPSKPYNIRTQTPPSSVSPNQPHPHIQT